MERSERETVIIYNQADADEGYFTVHTTIPAHERRLRRRVGKRLESIAPGIFRIPIELFQEATFGIRSRPPRPGSRPGPARGQKLPPDAAPEPQT